MEPDIRIGPDIVLDLTGAEPVIDLRGPSERPTIRRRPGRNPVWWALRALAKALSPIVARVEGR